MAVIKGQREQGISAFTSGQERVWVQIDPKPTSRILDFGLTQVGGPPDTSPDPEPILVPSRKYYNNWERVGAVQGPDEQQSIDFETTANGAGLSQWQQLKKRKLPFAMYITVGAVREGNALQADEAHVWTTKPIVYNALVTSASPLGDTANSRNENNEAVASGSVSFYGYAQAATVEFSEVESGTFSRAIVDLDTLWRGQYDEVFGVSANEAATAPSAVVYGRTDSGTGYTFTNISALSTDGLADASLVVGDNLILLRSTGTESHLYSTLDDVRAGNDNFADVTSGYVTSKGPTAGHVVSAGNIALVGLGGYIYRLTDVTSGATVVDAGTVTTNDLNDVRGANGQLIAGGASNTLLVSNDGGFNWATVAAPSAGAGIAINTVEVVAENQWYIGYADGAVYFGEYDEAAGTAQWTQLNLLGGAVPTTISRIRFFNPIFGWISGDDGSNGYVWRTSSAGVRFSANNPEVARFSTAYTSGTTAAAIGIVNENEVFVGGATATAGILAIGSA